MLPFSIFCVPLKQKLWDEIFLCFWPGLQWSGHAGSSRSVEMMKQVEMSGSDREG
jgi:hypothetical protein